jgi:hypothetical protein
MITLADWLAVYRATRLLQRDDVWPLPEVRAKIMDRYGTSRWSVLLDCPWCLSVWVAAGLLVLRAACPRLHAALVAVLAASAVTGIITHLVDAVSPPE